MGYSMEFKRAVAAAAVTRLAAGRRTLDVAARQVLARIGGVVWVTLEDDRKVKALLDYRKRIMALEQGRAAPPRLAIARFHYDSCLKWAEDGHFGPEQSADLMMDALLDG
ncbi:MAG: hypothetical protein VW338_01910 [Rhodospirillaceae bacterium]